MPPPVPDFGFPPGDTPKAAPLSQAFSLLEMLAALAILVILGAILVPAVQTMRSASDNAKCIGNLRAIGGALHAYILDHNGEYPPGRLRPVGERRYPSEALSNYISCLSSGVTERREVGPWFCPSDRERPMSLSARSYAPHSRLGAEDRTPDNAAPAWQPWWSKPSAAARSGQLIYLIDHNLQRIPLSTSGYFSEKSWPLPTGSTLPPPAPGSETSMVDFQRHHGHANALFVDGSVRSLTFEDLKETRWRYIDPTR